jgi:hypothetical protein
LESARSYLGEQRLKMMIERDTLLLGALIVRIGGEVDRDAGDGGVVDPFGEPSA